MNSPQPQPIDPAAYVLLAYLRAGFSVIPVGDDKRPSTLLPGMSWAPYQRQRATGKEWNEWWNQGSRSWAIICGQISGKPGVGGLYGLDGDDEGFNQWLLESGEADPLLKNTWVNLTGCGGPHVYLYSKIPVFSQILKSGNLKVADIRGDGQGEAGPSYLVAPPTHGICPKHGTPGTYRTIYGSPDQIMVVENARAVYQWLADKYAQARGAQPSSTVSVSSQGPVRPAVASSPEIPPPLVGQAREALETRVRTAKLSRKVKRALFQGVIARVGEWKDAPSDSEVDIALVCAMLRADFSDQEIVNCFSTLHAGDWTFKNAARDQHGLRYLNDYTVPAARKLIADSNAAAQTATGLNFVVLDHLYVPFDDVPMFYTTLRTNEGREIKVKLKSTDFESDRRFCKAIWEQSIPQFMPQLQTAHLGAVGFRIFMGVIGAMGRVEEDLPEGASESGYLLTVIKNMIRSSNARHATSDPQANHMAWIQDDWVVIRSEHLISRVKGVMGRIPTPQIWQAFSKMGGQYETVKLAGRTEPVWILPVATVGFDDE